MENFNLQAMAQQLRDKKAQVAESVAKFQMEANFNISGFYDDLHQQVRILMASVGISHLDSYLQQEIGKAIDFYQIPLEKEIKQAFNLQDIFPFPLENLSNTLPPTRSSFSLENSLQVISENLLEKKAQVEANLGKLQLQVAYLTAAFYNYLTQRMAILAAAGGSIPNPVLYLQEEIGKASTRYLLPLMLALTEAFNLQAVFLRENEEHGQQQALSQAGTSSAAAADNETENEANSGANASPGDGQDINNQEEMSGDVQVNAQQLAEQQSVIALYSSPPPASPPNAEQSINLSEFNSRSNADNQADQNGVIDNQANHVDAEDVADGALEDNEHVEIMEINENHHHDRQENDAEEEANAGIVALLVEDDEYVDIKSEPNSDVEEQLHDGAGDWRNEAEDYAMADAERLNNMFKQSRPQGRVNPNRRPSVPIKEEIVDDNRLAMVLYQPPPADHRDASGSIDEQEENYFNDDDASDNEEAIVEEEEEEFSGEESDHLEEQDVNMSDEDDVSFAYGDEGNDSEEEAVMDETDDEENADESMSDIEDKDENDNEEEEASYAEDDDESDSTIIDETNYEGDGQEGEELAQPALDVAGPSSRTLRRSTRNSARATQASSGQEQQVTRRVSKRQTVAGRSSNGPRNGRNEETEPLRVIMKKLKCTVPGCKKVVKSKNALNRHLLSAHKLKKYRCLVRRCYGKVSTSFTTKAQLSDHLDQVHGRTARLACHCSKKFNSYDDLGTHYRHYHELGQFTCSKENCTFKPTNTRIKIKTHLRNHLEAKHECPVDGCSKSFKRKSILDQHRLTHTGERPFACPECDKSFSEKGTLTRHLRIHRNDKCYRCTWPQCAHSSTERGNALRHIRMVHFELPATKKQQAEENINDDRDARDYLAMD